MKRLKREIESAENQLHYSMEKEIILAHELSELRKDIAVLENKIQSLVDKLDWEQTKATMMGRDV